MLEEIKKSDLKSGMEVILRNNHSYFLIRENIISIGDIESSPVKQSVYVAGSLKCYKNDLTHKFTHDFDIMKILLGEQVIWERGVEWNKIPSDTKVFVKNYNDTQWTRAYFDSYVSGKYYTYPNGKTFWTNKTDKLQSWEECRLAEDIKHEPEKEVTFEELMSAYKVYHDDIKSCHKCKYDDSPGYNCKVAWVTDNYKVIRK